jgi:hypothetical protein
MSVDLSGEITAIATAVLAAFAIITAVVAYMAFRRQTQEVGILQQQMKEQQDVLAREARERHRAQAARVFISLDYGDKQDDKRSAHFTVANTSDQPVYDAEIRWRHTQREAHHPVIRHTQLGTILPGDRPTVYPARIDLGARADPDDDRFTVLIFRDAAGAMWTRTLDGDLSELGTPDPDQQAPDQE